MTNFRTNKNKKAYPISKRRVSTGTYQKGTYHLSVPQTLFGKAKYQKYSDIVRIDTPKDALVSIRKLGYEFEHAKTREKKVRIKKVTVDAENRARVISEKSNNPWMKQQKEEIANYYQGAQEHMVIDGEKKEPNFMEKVKKTLT
jgi:hypothetical protein